MSFAADIKAAKARFHIYIDQLAALLREYNITGPKLVRKPEEGE
jgi:hypothetical protein